MNVQKLNQRRDSIQIFRHHPQAQKQAEMPAFVLGESKAHEPEKRYYK